MSRCISCGVKIADKVNKCPLCGMGLTLTGEEKNTYPDVSRKTKRLMLASRIYLFSAIVVEAIIVYVNELLDSGSLWSLAIGLLLLYAYLIIRFALLGKSGYKAKVIVLSAIAILMLIAVDYIIGYNGWSLNYVFPGIIIGVDIGIGVLMIVNHKNWQGYIMWQLLMIVSGLIPFILYFTGTITKPFVADLALAVSCFLFLGTIIIGGRKAQNELKRRFHIR